MMISDAWRKEVKTRHSKGRQRGPTLKVTKDLGSQYMVLQRETEKIYPQGNQNQGSQHKALQTETKRIYLKGNPDLETSNHREHKALNNT